LHAQDVLPHGVVEHAHLPFWQVDPPQSVPQPPQLLGSVLVFTHTPKQSSYGAAHRQELPEHVEPVPHVLGHCTVCPQLFVAGPHALPLHAVPLSVHPQPLAPAPPPPQVFGGAQVFGQVML
jgi:hypothetical protein